jgi:hypothetical protein
LRRVLEEELNPSIREGKEAAYEMELPREAL